MKCYIDWREKPVTLWLANLPVSLSLSRTLVFIRDLEILRRRRLGVRDLLSQLHFGGKMWLSSFCYEFYSENVAVAETSYQMLENLSFCDRDRAKPPSIKVTVLTLSVKKSTVRLSGVKYHTRSRSLPRRSLSCYPECEITVVYVVAFITSPFALTRLTAQTTIVTNL